MEHRRPRHWRAHGLAEGHGRIDARSHAAPAVLFRRRSKSARVRQSRGCESRAGHAGLRIPKRITSQGETRHDHDRRDQTVETTTAPRFAITLPAAELVTAVRNVAPFASTDDTLRVLCGVNLELAADGKVTLVATDRYVLATTEIQVGADSDLASFSGEGSVLLSADVVKMLAGVKARGSYELITLTVAADGALTVALPDTRVMTSAGDYQGAGFPDHRKLLGAFRPCDAGARSRRMRLQSRVPGQVRQDP